MIIIKDHNGNKMLVTKVNYRPKNGYWKYHQLIKVINTASIQNAKKSIRCYFEKNKCLYEFSVSDNFNFVKLEQ